MKRNFLRRNFSYINGAMSIYQLDNTNSLFQFLLNKEWPGTYADKKPKERARIKYEIKAICELPDRKKELKHKIELMVHETE